MKIHTIKGADGSTSKKKRVGRGSASGMGKTSTRGHKGQLARSGGGVRLNFEGGQMPLTRRVPKRGFNNTRFEKKYTAINIEALNSFADDAVVDTDALIKSGIIKKVEKYGLKIMGGGELKKKLTVKAQKFTKSASVAIEKAGGKAEVV